MSEWRVPVLSLDVCLLAAVTSQLILHEIGIVGGRDEVVAKRLAHILMKLPELWFKYGAFLRAEVHLEAIE